MKNSATLIFPHQIFKSHPAIKQGRAIFLIEDQHFFSDFPFHKQKIMLHRASMKAYGDYLKKHGHQITYLDHSESADLFKKLKHHAITELHCADLIEHSLVKRIAGECKKNKISISFYPTPLFLSPRDWLVEQFKDEKHFLMANFYKAQRLRMKILVDTKGKPIGGKWSFDAENRKPLQKGIKIPPLERMPASKYLDEARKYVNKFFKDNPGLLEEFIYPIDFGQAQTLLDSFLHHKLNLFGPYQDAIDPDEPFVFHSLLSSSLNIGLLTPQEVVDAALTYAKKHKTPIASLEGFIRQIIGWREFVAGVYLVYGDEQRTENFFGHNNKLPESFWTANTGLEPIDATIKKVLRYAYAHHIERLMLLGNIMLLCEIKPHDVYRWFMELFIDAYDWVMVPNVYGMSQYADGGKMTTKPYFSGSNYIKKMSSFKTGSWCVIWDALYWRFMAKQNKLMLKNPRLHMTALYLKRIGAEKLAEHIKTGNQFIKQLIKN